MNQLTDHLLERDRLKRHHGLQAQMWRGHLGNSLVIELADAS